MTTITLEHLVQVAENAVADLDAAMATYPELRTALGLARAGLASSLERAAQQTRHGSRVGTLRGAMRVTAGTLGFLRSARPDLEATSSLICDVEHGLRDYCTFQIVEA